MNEDDPVKRSQGKLYKGYCVDLMDYLEEELGFKGELHLVEDGNYGGLDPETKQWNGMVGAVYNKVLLVL